MVTAVAGFCSGTHLAGARARCRFAPVGPDEGPGVLVVGVDERADRRLELAGAAMSTSPQRDDLRHTFAMRTRAEAIAFIVEPPGCGHCPHVDAPGRLAREILPFAREL